MKILMALSNDFSTDKRVHNIAKSLTSAGHSVHIFARKHKNSPPLLPTSFDVKRQKHFFKRGFLFYAEFNIRFFLVALLSRNQIIWANDLDSLPAAWLASKLRRRVLVFDSHEFFSEVPELVHRGAIKKVWQKLENILIPRIQFGITVSEGIRHEYIRRFGVDFLLIRNMPYKVELPEIKDNNQPPYLMYQGALNPGRGLELMIETMKYLPEIHLIIAGSGPLEKKLKQLAHELKVSECIHFQGHIPFSQLYQTTMGAICGFSLEEDLGLNYRYALPNKLFDYIQAGIPVVVSDLPEMAHWVRTHHVGMVLEERTAENLSKIIKKNFTTSDCRNRWKQDIQKFRQEFIWENEEKRLIAWIEALTLPVR